ncbi:MAG: ATP-binding protein, partial [Candidatus Puniceispirillales bacterium]
LLIQVLINLLKNACEASDNNNKIKVKTIYNLGSRLTISESNSDHLSMLGVVVVNQGKGIPDAIKTRLFDPFVTAKAEGTGLGLALVASIIADHGGSVEVSDKDGETSFQINLPITRGMA